MDLKAITDLVADLKLWRETELASQQGIDDAEAHVIAADLKLQEYKDRHKAIAAKVDALGTELAEAIDDHTAPLEIVFLEGE